MTQEYKQLLLKDLSARLPYGVKCTTKSSWNGIYTIEGYKDNRVFLDCPVYDEGDDEWMIESIVPYLRPMSSMTEEEKNELEQLSEEYFGKSLDKQIQESLSSSNRNESRIFEYTASSVIVDWLNAHHFDYRGLIEKGLALEAPEGIYN